MTYMAAAVIGSALIGGIVNTVNSKRSDKQNKRMLDAQVAAQQERQKMLDQYGNPLMQQGGQNMGMVQNILRSRAAGNRQQLTQEFAPQINAMSAGQQGATQALRSQYGRGGQSASQAGMLPYQLQGNVNNMMYQGRNDAIGALGTLGNNQQSLGLQALGMGGGLTNSMLQYGLDARQLSMQQGQMLGQGVGGLGNMFMQYMMSRGNNTNPNLSQGNNSTFMGQGPYFGGYQGFGSGGYQPQYEEGTPSSTINPYNPPQGTYGGG